MSRVTDQQPKHNRKINKRWLWISAFCILGVFLVITVLNQQLAGGSSQLDPVILKLKWKHQFQFAGYYVALEKGFYRDAGLDVRIVEASDSSESTEAVLRGEAQFGIGASDLVVEYAKGEPIVVLAPIFQHSPLVLLTKQNAGITHIHDLVGKRVMLEPHSDELLAYLQDEGISANQLILYPHSFDPLPLINDEIDAMSAYITDEPYLLEKAGIQYQVFTPRSSGIDFYGDTLFTTQEQIREHPERVRAFLDASLRGWDYAFRNDDEVIDLILSNYSTRHSPGHLKYEAEQTRRLVMPDVVEIGYTYPGRWQHIADTYAKLGIISGQYSLESFIYNRTPKSHSLWFYTILGGILVIIALLLLVGLSQAAMKLYSLYKRAFTKD